MNIKLEGFCKEYICMEQDIHIEGHAGKCYAVRPHEKEK